MKQLLTFCIMALAAQMLYAQNDSALLIRLNQQIDSYVVQKNVAALDSLFAADFIFNHGSGKTEGKAGWFTTVARANYPYRNHDSVKVELHPAIAIVKGKMNIEKRNKDKADRYWLKYIRVFALRDNRWQLISHSTVQEQHEL